MNARIAGRWSRNHRRTTLLVLGLLLVGKLSGCSDTGVALPRVEVKAPKGLSDDVPGPARDLVEAALAQRFAVEDDTWRTARLNAYPDGGEVLGKAMAGVFGGGDLSDDALADVTRCIGGLELIELRKPQTTIYVDKLSEADRLNGITWRGTFDVRAAVTRARTLDLAGILSNRQGAVVIPWLAEPRTVLLPKVTNAAAAASASTQNLGLFGALFTGELLRSGLTGGEWGDWQDTPDDIVFRAVVTLSKRGDTVATWPDTEKTRAVTQYALPRGGLFSMAGADAQESVLCRPDLRALKKGDLL